MKVSERLQKEREFVVAALGTSVICERCGATLETFTDECNADLAELCPGFVAIEVAKQNFALGANVHGRLI